MAVSSPCPPVQDFRQLWFGLVSPGRVEELARHLEVCDRCAETVESLGAGDALAGWLRGAPWTG
jgi:hypothetical protein